MSDIQEQIKLAHKRAEENDYIVKDIAQYEENDSELAKYTILELQDRINKALELLNDWDYLDKIDCYHKPKEVIDILKGDNK